MAKPGKNKKVCEKYRLEGRREKNKEKSQLRHQKKMERFAKRKEEGKGYQYKKISDQDRHDMMVEKGIPCHYDYSKEAWVPDYKSDSPKDTPVSKWSSVMRKVDNEVAKEIAAEKAALKGSKK